MTVVYAAKALKDLDEIWENSAAERAQNAGDGGGGVICHPESKLDGCLPNKELPLAGKVLNYDVTS